MQLVSPYGTALSIQVVRYESLNPAHFAMDWDWLVVRVRGADGDRQWGLEAACLTVFELAALAEWLEAPTVRPGTTRRILEFVEPELSFEMLDGVVSEVLRVRLSATSPRSSSGWNQHETVVIDLPVEDLDIAGAAASLREQAARYPGRPRPGQGSIRQDSPQND